MFDEKTDISYRSGAGLIENIVRFSYLLRDNAISVSLPAVLDAIKGLPLIDISRMDEFLCLLRISFINCKEDLTKFDSLFYSYWLPKKRAALKIPAPAEGMRNSQNGRDLTRTFREKITDLNTTDDTAEKVPQKWALRYSPYSPPSTDQKQGLRFESSRELYESITKLLQPIANRISRLFQYNIHGKEISLRKILRKNMQFGGELILLDFKKKRLKKHRVIFFCDVSGSMDNYTLMILQFIHVLKRIDRSTEIFFFSTHLTRTTRQFARSDFASALTQIAITISDWGGGTRIGHCLQCFNETFGKKQLSDKDIVMIFSDGWDRGEIDELEKQLSSLRRKAYKIIWLNPLMGSRDYQPICQGMRAAIPYLDYFLPMANLQDLRSIGQILKKIII